MAKSNRSGQALVLNRQQVRDVWGELDYPHKLIAQLCYLSASRVGEIIRLKAENIVANEIHIYQPKVSSPKRIRINADIKAALEAAPLPSRGYLFPSRNKAGCLTARGYEKRLADAFSLLGIEGATTHSFRRSAATHLFTDGIDLHTIASLTGHQSLGSLSRYIEVGQDERDRKIADAMAGMVI